MLPKWRGRGLGRALLGYVARIAVTRGCGRGEGEVHVGEGDDFSAADFHAEFGHGETFFSVDGQSSQVAAIIEADGSVVNSRGRGR